MHYFKRNIGDYHKKAGRLSMLEHGAYTLLIDACYDRERFPTKEDAIDWCWARSDEEVAAVCFVLSKFFTLEDGVYVQQRIQDEINAYHSMSLKNKEIAQKREQQRREKRERSSTNRAPVVDDAPPNQEPRTKNQEPRTNKTLKSEKKFSDEDLSVAHEFWETLFDENPENKKPNIKAWAGTIRLMRERDSRTHQQITWLWQWVRADDFWSTNIRSPDKLRKHFDALVDRVKKQQSEKRNAKSTRQPQFENESHDWARDLLGESDSDGCGVGQQAVRAVAGDLPRLEAGIWDEREGLPGDEAAVDSRLYGSGH